MPERKSLRVVAAVIKEKGRIFATVRGYGKYKGWWEFPGGKIEEGETPQAALVREIREELAAEIAVHELIKTVEYDYPDFHLVMDCFWAEVISGDLVLQEAAEARWLTKGELDSVRWLPADQELISLIEKALENPTIEYYESNAEDFADSTIDVAFTDMQDRFLSHLPKAGVILDFGCGSGRDTKYFLKKGYAVDATDGSEKLCEIARNNTGINIRQMMFADLDEDGKYDGIWACASILHLPKDELKVVLEKIAAALKDHGVLYTSFKYGTFEGMRGGRYFTDFSENSSREFFEDVPALQIFKTWITNDVRPGREEERWINILARRS